MSSKSHTMTSYFKLCTKYDELNVTYTTKKENIELKKELKSETDILKNAKKEQDEKIALLERQVSDHTSLNDELTS